MSTRAATRGLEDDLEHLLLSRDEVHPSGYHTPAQARPHLRARLVGCDALAVFTGWFSGLIVPGLFMDETLAVILGNARWGVGGAVLSLGAIRAQQLYLSRNCVIRAVEIQRLMRACAVAGLGVFFLAQTLDRDVSFERMIIATFLAFVLLVTGRNIYRAKLRSVRRSGRLCRRVLIVGANEEAAEIFTLTQDHPESGFRAVGVVTLPGETTDLPLPIVGTPADVVDAARRLHATGVIVVASALPGAQLNPLVRRLLDARLHVHVASGIRGIAHQRVRAIPLAHEPLLYLEAAELSSLQHVVKRALDAVFATLAAMLSVPLLAIAAMAIYLEDGGPILFRQERVGRLGAPFTVLKLRTMVVDAEERMHEVRTLNERMDGPLFKVDRDPRVTRVGRLLRATSIDELPQLFNVMMGTMSLVGPRPALVAEAEKFDAVLRNRTIVRPGLTGLWQLEARDNPSFGAYRRLDLFYVENWSVALDFSIMIGTAAAVLGRACSVFRRGLLGRGSQSDRDVEPTTSPVISCS